ncbi:MAG: TrkA family potassium uptake protein [Chloroflexota bacterium]|nr:TrkA family potassium uptake protein [Chloroflexota bacterium]
MTTTTMRSRNFRRYLRALWRDTRVLVGQFRVSLFAFVTLLCGGTLALRFYYTYPDTGQGLGWAEALHAAFMFIFAETILPFPETLGLQILFFAIPPIGLAVVADGILRFGVGLFNRRERKEAWQVAIASTYRNHIVVCGLGKVGYRVVKSLLRLGEDVVGIEQDAASPFLEEIRQMKVSVLPGDARQREMLEKAGVREASAIVVCTQDDLTNLDIALDARELNPGIKVVMRMFDGQLAEKVKRGFGIHTAFSTSALAAPVFAAAATRAQIDHSFYVDDVLMNTARTTVQAGSTLEGLTITQVEQEFDITVVLHKGLDSLDLHPSPDIRLQAGDCLVVFASLESLARLRETGGERFPLSLPRGDSSRSRTRRRPWLARLLSRE